MLVVTAAEKRLSFRRRNPYTSFAAEDQNDKKEEPP
jgi:hypothetical protein